MSWRGMKRSNRKFNCWNINTLGRLRISRLIMKSLWRKLSFSSTRSVISCKSSIPIFWMSPKKIQKILYPNLTSRKNSMRRRLKLKFDWKNRKLQKSNPSTKNYNWEMKSSLKSSTNSRNKTRNSNKHSKNCSKSTTTSGLIISNQTRKFSKCSTNFSKDYKSLNPKRKLAKMQDMNKQL